MHACDYRKTMSGFIHGFRYNVRALSQILELKYHGNPLPYQVMAATSQAVLAKIIDRINTSSGMFLQPGFLQDLVVISERNGVAMYYEDLRADYIHSSPLGQNDHYYTISLEYGHFRSDPFSLERDPDPQKGNEAPYLHPVIKHFSRNRLVSEHHIQDDLENEWYAEQYVSSREFSLRAYCLLRQRSSRKWCWLSWSWCQGGNKRPVAPAAAAKQVVGPRLACILAGRV